jgi:hypothetical protein
MLAFAALLSGLPRAASAQIADGQLADFEDGTTQKWIINLLGGIAQPVAPAGVLPVNVATGGPAGAGDSYLRLTSVGGSGPGSKLSVLNPAFWGGDWLAAGVTSVRMNAINLGNTDLQLRFMVEDPTTGPPANVAVSAVPVFLAAGSGWQSLEFPIFGPNGLAALLGNANTALANVTIARVFHNPSFVPEAPAVVASVGLDNIRAVQSTVPEPSTFLLLGAGGLGLWFVRRRSTR